MSIIFTILAVILFAYLLLILFSKLLADKLIFPAPKSSYKLTENILKIKLCDKSGKEDSAESKEMAALYLPVANSKFCIIYNHGNGEDIGEIAPLLLEYQRNGISVFAYDYLGYGLSDKPASQENLLKCAATAAHYVNKNLGFEQKNIVVIGYSLGGAAACHIASIMPNIRALILVGAFNSATLAILPINILPWKILDNQNTIENLKSPVLFMHGTKDAIVPKRNALKNFNSAPENKRLILFKGFGHYKLIETPQYWEEILSLIERGTYEKSSRDYV